MSLHLPFSRLNLRFNPFGEALPDERAALAVVDVAGWSDRLARESGFALQLVGDSGRGKSTHLLALDARLARAGAEAALIRVGDDGRVAWPDTPIVLVDEIQHAPRRRRARLFRRRAALALGTHEDLSGELRRFGYEVETVAVGAVSVQRLEAICVRRIEWARRGPGAVPRVPRAAAVRLLERHGEDVRAIESELYEIFQTLKEPDDVRV